MSYQSVRNALETQLEAIANFDATKVSVADVAVLNRGVDRAVVVRFESFAHRRHTYGQVATDWRFGLHLYEKLDPDVPSVEAKMAADMQGIISRIDQYPMLSGTSGVLDSLVERGEDTAETVVVGGSRYFHSLLHVTITELAAVSYQE